jgi:hypothetical protein
MQPGMATARLEAGSVQLLLQALGPADGLGDKGLRLWRVLRGYGRRDELDARLAQLHGAGVIDEIPTTVQLIVGSIDMLRFWISPAAEDYYRDKGISYVFHQVLRFLEEPASLVDPVGFFSERDGIIGHLMQVVHANPVYDLQLLMMFDDGLDQLEAQLEQMLAGTHPRAATIGAIVEEPDYHARLLAFVRAWRKDPARPPLLRSNVAGGKFSDAEQTFGTLPSAMRYFARLPRTAVGAARHFVTMRAFEQTRALRD